MMTADVIDGMLRALNKHVDRCAKCAERNVYDSPPDALTTGGVWYYVRKKTLIERGHCDKAIRMSQRLWDAVGKYRRQRIAA